MSAAEQERPPAQRMQEMVMQLFTQETLQQVNEKLDDWDKRLTGFTLADKAHEATGARRVYIALGAVLLSLMFIFFGFGMKFLTTFIGFAAPAYQSFKSLESKRSEDDRQWLAYWVVFGFLELLENFVGFILMWVPFYYTLKLLFVVALQIPQLKGAEVVYEHFLRNILRTFAPKIDEMAARGATVVAYGVDQLTGAEPYAASGGGSDLDRAQGYDEEARTEDDGISASRKKEQ